MKYVMSDLHGCFDEFLEILEQISFSGEDELYIIGDVIDRGPEPLRLLKYIMDKSNMHLLLGNHEDMMRKSCQLDGFPCDNEKTKMGVSSEHRNRWYMNGGYITDTQYEGLPDSEKQEILDYLDSLPLVMEVEANGREFLLLHGGPTADFASEWEAGKVSEDIIWERPTRLFSGDSIIPGKTFIVGHTPTFFYGSEGLVIMVDQKWLIDCGCVFGYSLGCVCLDDEKVYYVESRQARL